MKDKIIKEMAKSIDTIYLVRTTEIGEDWLNEILKERKIACAYKLYNAGYRKIPEGAVVLTREEQENHIIMTKVNYESIMQQLKQARKGTAREICLKIIKELPQPIKEKWVEWFKKEYGVGGVENGD